MFRAQGLGLRVLGLLGLWFKFKGCMGLYMGHRGNIWADRNILYGDWIEWPYRGYGGLSECIGE